MIAVGIIGGVCLAAFTVWLAIRNWSPDVQKPVATIVVGGLVVLLATLLTVLRSSEMQRNFVSSVVIDERTHLPASIGFLGSPIPDVTSELPNRITARHATTDWLARREPVSVQPIERLDSIAAEFFQYKLLLDLADSTGSDTQSIRVGPDEHGTNRISVSIRRKMRPPKPDLVAGEKVLGWLTGNRLSRLPIEIGQWKSRGLWLPRGAEIKLTDQIVGTIPSRTFTVAVPGVFQASIEVEGRGSAGLGILPPAVLGDPDVVKHYGTYSIVVKMQARFEWLSAASPDMSGYKEWVSFVFGRLEQLNSDDPSSLPIVAKPAGT